MRRYLCVLTLAAMMTSSARATPACGYSGSLVPAAESSRLLGFGPLGHLIPGSHVFPEMWGYLLLQSEKISPAPLVNCPSIPIWRQKKVHIVAPGQIVVTSVTTTRYHQADRSAPPPDPSVLPPLRRISYSVCFRSTDAECTGVDLCVTDLNEDISLAIKDVSQPAPCRSDRRDEWSVIVSCERDLHTGGGPALQQGDAIGSVGGGTGGGCGYQDTRGVNVRAIDYNRITTQFYNNLDYEPSPPVPNAVDARLHSLCPRDYIAPFALLPYGTAAVLADGTGLALTPTGWRDAAGNPSCGTFNYDLLSTDSPQGNWFFWSSVLPSEAERKDRQLSLAFDEVVPTRPIISGFQLLNGANGFAIPGEFRGITYAINPNPGPGSQDNLAYSQMRSNQLYCIKNLKDAFDHDAPLPGRLVVYMTTSNGKKWLYLQHQPANSTCAGLTMDTNYINYFVR